MVEDDSSQAADDKEYEKCEGGDLGDVEVIQDESQDDGQSVGEDDGQETSVHQVPRQFLRLAFHNRLFRLPHSVGTIIVIR